MISGQTIYSGNERICLQHIGDDAAKEKQVQKTGTLLPC